MQAKREQWAERLAAWRSSGQSQAGWCREHGVSLASLGYWRRRLADEAAPASPAMLPIQLAAMHEARVEVCLPDGIVLRVAASDPVWLARLLRSLGPC
jgi:transposase-like protein